MGRGRRRDLAGAEVALVGAATALAWPRWRRRPWLGRVLAWRRRGPGGAAVEMGIGGAHAFLGGAAVEMGIWVGAAARLG
jgi:hypothetical protein